MSDTTTEPWKEPRTVEDLLALTQINAILVAYCQGVDRRDWDQVLSCYHDDAHESHGQYVGGPAGFVEWLQTNHEHVISSMHQLSNVTIKLSAGHPGFARAESYCLSHKAVASSKADTFFSSVGDDQLLRRTVAVRYVDTLEDRPGVGWRILRRDVAFEWVRREPGDIYFPLEGDMDNSTRDRDDLWFSPLAIPGQSTGD